MKKRQVWEKTKTILIYILLVVLTGCVAKTISACFSFSRDYEVVAALIGLPGLVALGCWIGKSGGRGYS